MVAIYAGFAIFLATLIWIYLSWLILLIGAQLSFYVQNPRYLRVGQGHVRLTSALRERLAFTVMLLIARKFVAGEPPWQLRALAEDLEIPGSALASVIALARAGRAPDADRGRRGDPGAGPRGHPARRRPQRGPRRAAVRNLAAVARAHRAGG